MELFHALCEGGVHEFKGYAEAESNSPDKSDDTFFRSYLDSIRLMEAGVVAADIAQKIWQDATTFTGDEHEDDYGEREWIYDQLHEACEGQKKLGHFHVSDWLGTIRDCYESESYTALAI